MVTSLKPHDLRDSFMACVGKKKGGTDYTPMVVDPTTDRLLVSDVGSSAQDLGRNFVCTDYIEDLDTDSYHDYLIVTPDTAVYSNFTVEIEAAGSYILTLKEDCNHVPGTNLDTFNTNRPREKDNSQSASLLIYERGSSGLDDGDLIYTKYVYSSSGSLNYSRPFVLYPDTIYDLIITSKTDNNIINVEMTWEEKEGI